MSLSPINSNWRHDANEYYRLVDEGLKELLADERMMSSLEKLHPNSDIKKSLEKNILQMWGIEKGWDYKRHSTVKRINMKQTLFDTIKCSLVDKSPFASRIDETKRDAKPVVEPIEERRNIHLQELATRIGAALMKIPERQKLSEEYLNGFNAALKDGKEEKFIEEFHAKLKEKYPEAFVIRPENNFFAQSQAQTKYSNEDRERARRDFINARL